MSGDEKQAFTQLLTMVTAMSARLDGLAAKVEGQPEPGTALSKKPEGRRPGRPETAEPAPPTAPEEITPRDKRFSIDDRIRVALENTFLDTEGLARAINDSEANTAAAITKLQSAGKLVNVGSEDYQSWFWRPGPDVDHKGLMDAIKRLISHQPLPVKMILRATGATTRQVDAALIDIRRKEKVWNTRSSGRRKCYFILPPDAQDATLTPRRVPKR